MSQIKKKFIEDNAIDGIKLQLMNGQGLRVKNADGSDRTLFYFNSSNEWQFNIAPKLSVNPSAQNDLVRKKYVDDEIATEASARIAAVSAEESARIAADNALDGRLDILEGSNTTAGSVAKALKDAKDYADTKISDLVNGAPGILDTLKELSDALGGDANFATSIANQIAGLSGDISALQSSSGADLSAEESARIAADNALDGRLDVLEGADTVVGSVAKALKDAKAYTDQEVATEYSARVAADNAEQSARIAADNALDGRLDILEGSDSTEGSVAKAEKDAKDYADSLNSAEQSARIAADNALDGRLDILEGADTVVGSVAKALKDAKAYTDQEVTAEESARIAAVSAEESARIAADNALDGRLDIIEGADTVVGSVAKALKDAKAYADAIDTDLQGQIDSLDGYTLDLRGDLDQEISDRIAAVSAEQSARIAADNALDGRLDVLEGADTVVGSVAKALKDAKAYTDSSVSAEESARIAADNALDGRLDILEGADTVAGSVAKALKDAKAYTDSEVNAEESARIAAVSAEESARIAADNALDGRLDILEGNDTTAGSVAKALKDAKDYTDQEVAALVNGAPALLDTLKELADAINDDASFATTVATNIGNEASARAAADTTLQGNIDAEQSARIAADNALDGRLDILEGADTVVGSVAKALKDAKAYTDVETSARQAAVSAEESARIAADNALDGRLDILEGADTVVGSVAKALKDAKAYTDVETSARMAAVSAEESARIAADSAEQSARIAAVSAEESARIAADNALDGRLDILEGADTVVGSVAKALKDAKAYTDSEVSAEESARIAADALLQGDIDAEESARIAADNALDGRLDILEGADTVVGSVAKALKDAKAYADGLNNAEQTARIAADGVLQSNIDALDGRLDILEGADTVVGSVAKALKDAKDYTDAEVSAEESARIAADNALDARLDIIEGADSVAGSVAKALKDAKDYTDAEVAAEASTRSTADAALQSAIDALEAIVHEKEKFVLTSTNISNGYINLAHQAIEKSILMTVDRLVAHAGDDYTVSVVGGVTRITFAGSLVSGEDEELVAGDIVRVMYRYS